MYNFLKINIETGSKKEVTALRFGIKVALMMYSLVRTVKKTEAEPTLPLETAICQEFFFLAFPAELGI